jgi:hypothetical protein
VQVCFPHGIPDEAKNVVSVDVNGIQVPMSALGEQSQTLLIDFSKKNVE